MILLFRGSPCGQSVTARHQIHFRILPETTHINPHIFCPELKEPRPQVFQADILGKWDSLTGHWYPLISVHKGDMSLAQQCEKAQKACLVSMVQDCAACSIRKSTTVLGYLSTFEVPEALGHDLGLPRAGTVRAHLCCLRFRFS